MRTPSAAQPAKQMPNPEPRAVSRWGQDRRLEFIDFRLRWDGRLNRSDLIGFFGISVPQASLDIARYTELAPANLVYDRSARVYVSGSQFVPLYPGSSSSHYLNELLASEVGLLTSETSFIGWRPPVGFVPSPGRAIRADTLVPLLRAIREGGGVRARYQSMSRPEPQERRLTPHAFVYDGFRWHVRAYCESRAEFRDFVIARMNDVQLDEPSGPGSAGDTAWNTMTELVLVPNPKLELPHRRALEVDYGMVDGEARMQCREALVFYVLRHLGLHVDLSEHPESQQVVLKDKSQVVKYLAPSLLP